MRRQKCGVVDDPVGCARCDNAWRTVPGSLRYRGSTQVIKESEEQGAICPDYTAIQRNLQYLMMIS
jgi:hypothetical protein